MANPQKENGYTAIANEIMDFLAKTRIKGQARQVLDLIFRKTYGFNKKQDKIALSQFVLGTGLKKNKICQLIKYLININIITQKGNDYIKTYRINKDFNTWKPLPKKVTLPKKVKGVPQKGNDVYPKKGTTKVDITKVDITKDKASKARNEINLLINIFEKINPTINYGNKTNRKASEDLIKQFTFKKVWLFAGFAVSVQGKQFAPVITTPYQLKNKLAELKIYYEKENSKSNKYQVGKV